MAKRVLVLDEEQFREIKDTFDAAMRGSFVPQDCETTNFYGSIRDAFKRAEKESSNDMLVWHNAKADGLPDRKGRYLVRRGNADYFLAEVTENGYPGLYGRDIDGGVIVIDRDRVTGDFAWAFLG